MQRKDNFFADNDDIRFHLTKRVDFDAIFAALSAEAREATGCTDANEYRELMLTMLDALGALCGEVLAPGAAQVEKEPITLKDGEVELPPTIVNNLAKLLEIGCAGLGISPAYGGMGIPFLVEIAGNELINRACPSTGLNIGWYSGIAHILEKFASKEIKDRVIPRMTSGEWSGSMALTEPDAGSDLASLRTYGEKQPDGTYRLYGTKRFISNGNSQVALVLGKTEKGAHGLDKLNLYMCLRKGDDGRYNYQVTKIEDKLGLHGSATCELAFDGAVAELVGEEGKGFQNMLYLMNDARIAVAFQGIGQMEAVYRLTRAYCDDRKTWGRSLSRHELVAEKLLDMDVDIRALRSLCYQASFNQSMLLLGERQLKEDQLSDEERAAVERRTTRARRRVRRWTPLVKWYAAERAVDIARIGLQLHGGYGFTKEYRAEFWMRESLILPIYEGTSQIQALMCVKDTMKEVTRQPRSFVEKALGVKVQTLRASDPLRKKLYRAMQLESSAILAILVKLFKVNVRASMPDRVSGDLVAMVKAMGRDLVKMENVAPAMLHAERLCEIRTLVALAQCLVWDAETDPNRRPYAERFLNRTWPRLEMLKAEIEVEDPVLAQLLNDGDGQVRNTHIGAGAEADSVAAT